MRDKIIEMVRQYARQNPQRINGCPVSGRIYDENEIIALINSALDFQLTTSQWNDAFEKALSLYIGTRYTLTCNSGSSANLLAVSALSSHLLPDPLKQGDEVITCATGFPTTVNPILQNGFVPVFLDVDIPTYNIDTSLLEDALTDKTRAIVLAHTLGNPFDIQRIMNFANEHDLYVIEDCCDALGSEYAGQKVGTFGDIGTLSFYPAHHITTGEGGAVFTQKSILKRILESMRDWGRDCYCAPGVDNTCKKRYDWQLGALPHGYDHKYTYSHLGYNLKMTDMQAAIGYAQMGKVHNFAEKRKHNFGTLYNRLKEFQDHLILPKATPNSAPVWFGFPITVKGDFRNDLLEYLNANHIGTRLLFGGNLTKQPYMKGRDFRIISDLKNSDTVINNTFWVGVYAGLNSDSMHYMADKIGEYLNAL